jgi:kynurenine formamidase
MEVGEWLAEKKVIAVGVDNFGLDVMPDEVKGEVIPVHLHLLTKNGIRIIENMYLEELARDKVYEFLFVCLPVRFKGAAASPVTPIAVT